MALLDALPEELLHDVLGHVHRTSDSSNNLFNVLTVARKYCRIAKDILYKAPRLLKPGSKSQLSWNDRRAHQLGGLLQRLVAEPGLARQVEKLDLCIIFERSSELCTWSSIECPKIEHWPSWETFSALVDELHIGPKSSEGVFYLRTAYSRHLITRFEPATVSLILAVVPSLRNLALHTYIQTHHEGLPGKFRRRSIHFKEWYGRAIIRKPDAIIGLANLVNLKSNDLLFWPLMCKPKVHSLEMILPIATAVPRHSRLPDMNFNISSSITTLIIGVKCYAWNDGLSIYVLKLTERLPCLTKLQFSISGHLKDFELAGGYEFTLTRIEAPALQTLVFETRGIKYNTESANDEDLILAQSSQIKSLTRFPDLRRIVGPVEAFMAHSNQEPCVFPRSINSIEIVNSLDEQVPGFVHTLVESDNLPNLKSILVWQNRKDNPECQDIIVQEEVRAWSQRRGIVISSGKGDMGLSQGW
ncbi:hypothetical protein IQ06DRAFT_38890 [Phaeosphaeriaceae sp. SRC1lsM3a]|nr:hypothetical protein IQ06DRAFT_38890 [Stagonospora sp. SRC1lsM3a]